MQLWRGDGKGREGISSNYRGITGHAPSDYLEDCKSGGDVSRKHVQAPGRGLFEKRYSLVKDRKTDRGSSVILKVDHYLNI